MDVRIDGKKETVVDPFFCTIGDRRQKGPEHLKIWNLMLFILNWNQEYSSISTRINESLQYHDHGTSKQRCSKSA